MSTPANRTQGSWSSSLLPVYRYRAREHPDPLLLNMVEHFIQLSFVDRVSTPSLYKIRHRKSILVNVNFSEGSSNIQIIRREVFFKLKYYTKKRESLLYYSRLSYATHNQNFLLIISNNFSKRARVSSENIIVRIFLTI